MATVRDLDTRLDEQEQSFAELRTEVRELKADVGELKTVIRRLEADVGELKTEIREFKAEVRTLVMLGKWLAGFTATTAVTLLVLALTGVYAAGRLSATVEQQAKETGRLGDRVEKLAQQMEELRVEVRGARPAKQP